MSTSVVHWMIFFQLKSRTAAENWGQRERQEPAACDDAARLVRLVSVTTDWPAGPRCSRRRHLSRRCGVPCCRPSGWRQSVGTRLSAVGVVEVDRTSTTWSTSEDLSSRYRHPTVRRHYVTAVITATDCSSSSSRTGVRTGRLSVSDTSVSTFTGVRQRLGTHTHTHTRGRRAVETKLPGFSTASSQVGTSSPPPRQVLRYRYVRSIRPF